MRYVPGKSAVFGLMLVCAAFATGARGEGVFPYPYQTEKLDNGLTVVTVPMDSPGLVAFWTIVRTGSRDEVEPGKSGFAHFFEHMMFRGTKQFPGPVYDRIVAGLGADANAYTTDDYTAYHLQFAKNGLEKVMEIESDRFRHLDYSEEAFQTEAGAIYGEYRKSVTQPFFSLEEKLRDTAFDLHPYKHTTMGFEADVKNMPQGYQYSRSFFQRFYRPENTILLVVGDIQPPKVLELVKRYYGDWKPGYMPPKIEQEPPQRAERQAEVSYPGQTLPILTVAYKGAPLDPSDRSFAAARLLEDLAFGENSDLYKKLVLQEQKVEFLFANFPLNRDMPLFEITAMVRKEEDIPYVRGEIDRTLEQFKETPVGADKLDAVKRHNKYQFLMALDAPSRVAEALARFLGVAGNVETVDGLFHQMDQVTPQDIQQATKTYFDPNRRTVVVLKSSTEMETGSQPALGFGGLAANAKTPAAASAEGGPSKKQSTPIFGVVQKRGSVGDTSRSRLPSGTCGARSRSASGTYPLLPVLEPCPIFKTASFGLVARAGESASEPSSPSARIPEEQVIKLPVETDPSVSLRIWFQVGAQNDPRGKEGLAALTAAMLTEGATREHSYEEILDLLFPLAGRYGASTSMEMTVVSGRIHKDNLADYYPLFVQAILSPAFKQEDLDRLKKQSLNYLQNTLRYAGDEELGKAVLYNTLFSGTPYGHVTEGTIEGVRSITLDDVKKFYREHYTRDCVVIGIGGGCDAATVERLREDLARLPAGQPAEVPPPQPETIQGRKVVIVEKDAPATAISMGFPISVRRGSRDWYALAIANSWLGEHRNTSSHLFQVLREARGLNYGDYSYIEYFPNGGYLRVPPQNVARRQQIFEIWIRPVPNEARVFALRAALRELKLLVDRGMKREDFELSRKFLKNYVLHYAPTTMERLGYALDDRFYGIEGSHLEKFRRMMDEITLEEVNAAIRKYLQYDDLLIAMVTDDAEGLKKALVRDAPSPYEYPTSKPQAVLEEDRQISTFPLQIEPENVTIVPIETLFVR